MIGHSFWQEVRKGTRSTTPAPGLTQRDRPGPGGGGRRDRPVLDGTMDTTAAQVRRHAHDPDRLPDGRAGDEQDATTPASKEASTKDTRSPCNH
jgi:hypothetical protein